MEVEFEIPGKVIPKGRPRMNLSTGAIYTPKKTKDYERYVAIVTKKYIQTPYEDPLRVDITIARKPPKSWPKTKTTQALKSEIYPTVLPDIDNLAKSLLDGMEKVAYTNDKLICELHCKKIYQEEEKAIIKISPL